MGFLVFIFELMTKGVWVFSRESTVGLPNDIASMSLRSQEEKMKVCFEMLMLKSLIVS